MSRAHLAPPAPAELEWIQPFVDASVLSAVDVGFGALVDRMLVPRAQNPADRQSVVLAAALCSRAPRLGHVALDVTTVASTAAVDVPARVHDTAGTEPLEWPDPEMWLATLQRFFRNGWLDPVVRGGQNRLDTGEPAALMVFANGLLYLERYFAYEERVAASLRGLANAPTVGSDAALEAIAAMLPGDGPQRRAAEHALSNRLTVIAGGPGTGKTYTITRVLAALIADAARPVRIGLAAPTGKAASRMKEALYAAATDLAEGPGLADLNTSTVHRLLGYRDGIRFRHDRNNPLPFDVVVVDEVSMVSLPLMGRLVDAIGSDTRLVLVGDPYQLASVEAGAVLGDITRTDGVVGESIVALSEARRFAESSGVAKLSEAIRLGNADRALDILGDPTFSDVALTDLADSAPILQRAVVNGCAALELAAGGDGPGALDRIGHTKLLCGTRKGDNGRDAWQARIETGVLSAISGRAHRGRWYVGKPVIATANDYLLGLFNGDTGIVVQHDGRRRVVFPDSGNPEPLDPAQVGQLDTWWTMTIHKSQGSEFNHAVIALPDTGSPILTRELLYTGVTRAKEQVTVVATAEAVRAAIGNPIRRASGLAALLS